MSFYRKYFEFIDSLEFPENLPGGVELLNPFRRPETYELARQFYRKFYDDDKKRLFLIGINPGRFGAGVTGVPFTDPIRLETQCGIPNHLDKKPELSSVFVYEMIDAFGGVKDFYANVFFTSVSPLGFVKNGLNINYYDIPELQRFLEPYMVDSLKKQIAMGGIRTIAYSMGKGKNFKYLTYLNEKYALFDKIDHLPHPRWVMQYRLKRKQEFIDEYLTKIHNALEQS